MKSIIVFNLLCIFGFNAMASTTLVDVTTARVTSSSQAPGTNPATSCNYAIVDKGDGQIMLYLNADSNSGINGSAYIDGVKLPLIQGSNPTHFKNITIERNGSIVTYTEKREAPGFGYYVDVITLDVSADLKSIRRGTYQSYATEFFGKRIWETLDCKF